MNLEFLGIKVILDGESGHVEFPDPARPRVPLLLSSAKRPPLPVGEGRVRAVADRTYYVNRWLEILKSVECTQAEAAGVLAKQTGKKISLRTLQLWSKQLEQPVSAFRRFDVSTFAADQKREALLITAWWAWRINNVKSIDGRMFRAALTLIDQGYSVADVLATIDGYYAYDTDRAKFPFKSFVRWVKYDFPKWLLRAADAADFRRALAAAKLERNQSRDQSRARQEAVYHPGTPVPDAKERKRDANAPRTQRAIASLDQSAGAGKMVPLSPRERAGVRAPEQSSRVAVEGASTLARMGLETAARQVAVSAISPHAVGPTPLAANQSPATMAEALGRLDDRMRCMLLRAAGADRDSEAKEARTQAAATIVLWWEAMPETVRNNIDFAARQWKADHPRVDDQAVSRRRVQMLIPHLRKREGFTTLGVVSRMPAR